MVLDRIQKENDIKSLTNAEIEELKDEIREFLITTISETGGHLASNLGVIVASHSCFFLHLHQTFSWLLGK